MKTLVIPLLLTLLPMAILYFLLKGIKGRFALSLFLKLLLNFVFVLTGLLSSFYAFNLSIAGMQEENIRCMTGAAAFPLLGLIVSGIGIPLLLFLHPAGRKPANNVYTKSR